MPYNLSRLNTQEKNLIASDSPYLVLLEVDVRDITTGLTSETLYLAHNNEDVIHEGTTYNAASFSISLKVSTSSQPSMTLSVDDITGAIQERMQQHKGGVGFYVRLKVVSSIMLNEPAEINESFEVIESSANGYTIDWTLGTKNMLGKQFPNRRQLKNRCSWQYKSPECGYSGAMTSCDYSMNGDNGCLAHSNTKNFGGFPGIKSNGSMRI